jgi:hypothetical protein
MRRASWAPVERDGKPVPGAGVRDYLCRVEASQSEVGIGGTLADVEGVNRYNDVRSKKLYRPAVRSVDYVNRTFTFLCSTF